MSEEEEEEDGEVLVRDGDAVNLRFYSQHGFSNVRFGVTVLLH